MPENFETTLLIPMLVLEAEGKPAKHKPIAHQKSRHIMNRYETSFRALDSPKLHKRSTVREHRGNPNHFSKGDFRRALDVDIDVKQSRSKGSHRGEGSNHDESDSEKKINGFFDGLPFMQKENQTCEECVQEQKEIFKELSEKIMKNEEKAKSGVMKPAYKCDEWEEKTRTCWLNRNIGDTVTFILSFKIKMKRAPKVIWKQEFHERGKEERKQFVLQREFPTWNTVIGSKGHEIRVSPVSEIDLDPNLFSAGLAGEDDDEELTSALFFRIRLIPNDLGFVYPGETVILNMASYISLPLESLHYVWYMEKDSEFDALPSNMKSSPSGSVLTISELRKDQEGIMTCAVYSSLEILVAKKRFLIKEISTNDILMNPTNQSHFFERKRNSQHSRIRRRKPEEKIEKSLRQLESENSGKVTKKEGFDVDYNIDKEDFSFIDELLESPSVDSYKASDLNNVASSKPQQEYLKLPPPASAVKMDAIQKERKDLQNSPGSFNVAQQQQEPQYQQQQESQYQQQQSQYQPQQQPQPEQQQPQPEQQQPQPEQQQLQYEQHIQYEQHRQQYEQQLLQQEQQQRLQEQQQYEQQRLQQEQYEQQRLQQEQQHRLQQEQHQRMQQEQQQRLQQEQQQRLQQEQQQRLQQEQQQRLQQEQQRLHQEQRQQPIYPGEGREPLTEQEPSSEESEHSAEQNLSPSLAKYSMGRIYKPKENGNSKGESLLSRQRHSTELTSPVEQMARPSEQYSGGNYRPNSGQQNVPNRQYSEKKMTPFDQNEYSSHNFPANNREHSQNEFGSPEMFIENKEPRPEDEISKIISRCQKDRECAGNAACIKGQATGFCRCLPNFHGNGISCWEDMVPRNSKRFSG